MTTVNAAVGSRKRHLRSYAAVSVIVWIALVGVAHWQLRRVQPAQARVLPLTHPDSIGLPLVAFAIVVAGVLAAANVVAAAVLYWRRRR